MIVRRAPLGTTRRGRRHRTDSNLVNFHFIAKNYVVHFNEIAQLFCTVWFVDATILRAKQHGMCASSADSGKTLPLKIRDETFSFTQNQDADFSSSGIAVCKLLPCQFFTAESLVAVEEEEEVSAESCVSGAPEDQPSPGDLGQVMGEDTRN